MDFFNAVLIVYTIFIYNNEKRLQTQAVVQESWRYYFTFSHLHFTVHSAQCNFQFFYFLLMMIGIKIQFIIIIHLYTFRSEPLAN